MMVDKNWLAEKDEMIAGGYFELLLATKKTVELLTDNEFTNAISIAPWSALIYSPSFNRLTTEQFNKCAERCGWIVLELDHVCKRLSDDAFDAAIKDNYVLALSRVTPFERMSREQFAAVLKTSSFHRHPVAYYRLTWANYPAGAGYYQSEQHLLDRMEKENLNEFGSDVIVHEALVQTPHELTEDGSAPRYY
jgi:hypothetical protein